MPHIVIKGMDITSVKKISKNMVDELTDIIGCPRDYFTLEVAASQFVSDGEVISRDPFIQINWFDRGQAVQDQTAAAITRHIKDAGCGNAEIFFTILQRNNYYENGEHL